EGRRRQGPARGAARQAHRHADRDPGRAARATGGSDSGATAGALASPSLTRRACSTMERMRKYVQIAISLVLVGAGVAFILKSRNRGVDVSDADAKLKTWAEANVAPVDKVTCPEAKLKKGNAFDCKVDFTGGKSYPLHVVVTDDSGMVEYSWATPISSGEKL